MKRFLGFSLIAMIAMTTMVTTSCSKYEEGSKFTLLSAKARLVNVWTLTAATANGTSMLTSGVTMKVEIKKDETYTMTYTAGTLSSTSAGKWAFNDDKTKVTFTETGSTTGDIFDIVMLKNKDLKLQQVDSGVTYLYTYTAE